MSGSRLSGKALLGFGAYDFSNSGYVLIFQSFLFPLFFAAEVAEWFGEPERVWGIVVAASTVLAVIVAPRIGAVGDQVGKGRVFLACVLVTGLGALAVSLGGSLSPAIVVFGFLAFNAVFETSQALYDSFLKELADNLRDTVRLSTFGWGFGYLGGALFAGVYLWLDSMQVDQGAMLAIFACAFLLLSLPACRFLWTKEKRPPLTKTVGGGRGLMEVIRSVFVLRTKSPIAFRHLVVYWLVVDAVAGVMYFAPLFLTTEVGLSMTTVGSLLLASQLLAAPATYVVGLAAIRWGLVLVIRLTLVGWIVALIGIFMSTTVGDVVLAMVPMVMVIGSTQALLRAHFSQHVSRASAGEGFGYYAIAQKSAAVLTPLLVSAIATITGSLRPAFAVLALVIFLAAWVAARLPGGSSVDDAVAAK